LTVVDVNPCWVGRGRGVTASAVFNVDLGTVASVRSTSDTVTVVKVDLTGRPGSRSTFDTTFRDRFPVTSRG